MPKGENAEEMPDDKLNPCGEALGNMEAFVNDEGNEGGEAAKRGGGDDIA